MLPLQVIIYTCDNQQEIKIMKEGIPNKKNQLEEAKDDLIMLKLLLTGLVNDSKNEEQNVSAESLATYIRNTDTALARLEDHINQINK